RLTVSGDRIDLTAESGLRKDDLENDKQHDKNNGRYRNDSPDPHLKDFKRRRRHTFLFAVRKRNTDTIRPESCKSAGNIHGCKRYDKCLKFQFCDAESVKETKQRSQNQTCHHCRNKAETAHYHEIRAACRNKTYYRTNSKIDISKDQDQRHTNGDDSVF